MRYGGWMVVVLACASAQSLAARTLRVGQGPGFDYATVSAAMTAAATGDTILVYPGVYNERAYFQGKSVILTSTDPTSPAVVAATMP